MEPSRKKSNACQTSLAETPARQQKFLEGLKAKAKIQIHADALGEG